jgi:acetamidase/formamidase
MRHHLHATPHTVHLGGFSPAVPVAITVDSGDEVYVETFTGRDVRHDAPPALATPRVLACWAGLPDDRRVGPGPHLLTGPIAVRGAEAGDVLEVGIRSVELAADAGWCAILPGWGVLAERFPQAVTRFVAIDRAGRRAEFPAGSGIHVPLRPFFGTLGVAVPGAAVSSVPPGAFGGNLDLRHLTAGTRLLLPVFVAGALLSVGDAHAAQGDGEACATAIETHADGLLKLTLRRDVALRAPVAITGHDLIITGFGDTLDAAMAAAVNNAVDLLVSVGGLPPEDAYVLCSIAIDFGVTQAVNAPVKGVHAVLPKQLVPALGSL